EFDMPVSRFGAQPRKSDWTISDCASVQV
ncbi:hypothetical protein SAMN05192541_14959, partial [Bradyrhizobium arachidis]